MGLLWLTVFLCVHQVFGVPDFTPEKYPDAILKLLKSTYKSEQYDAGADAGEPLLLTPYILRNQTSEAKEAARVDPKLFLGKESYAGYLTVNEEYNSNMWFWYIPVSGMPVGETPWILWLQGGPGVSSLFGLFTEIGPFAITEDHLEEIKYSWGKNHSLLFIDNPVGTGYSFSNYRGFSTNQTMVGKNLYNAVQQFLTIFPELRQAPLTIAGESYAGKYIPSLGFQILSNKNEIKPINLQGLAIGNGLIDPVTLTSGYSAFLREVGLLDDTQAYDMNIIENRIKWSIAQGAFRRAWSYHNELLYLYDSNSQLDFYNTYNYLDDSYHEPLGSNEFIRFIQKDEIRQALHVGTVTYDGMNNWVYRYLIGDIMQSVRPWLEALIDNYKVMLYNGQLDVIVGYRPSVKTYNALNFSGAAEYKDSERKAWYHNGIVAGYYKVGGNLTEVMVRGAGHMVPSDKPSAALGLISAFIRGIPLEKDTGYLVEG